MPPSIGISTTASSSGEDAVLQAQPLRHSLGIRLISAADIDEAEQVWHTRAIQEANKAAQ